VDPDRVLNLGEWTLGSDSRRPHSRHKCLPPIYRREKPLSLRPDASLSIARDMSYEDGWTLRRSGLMRLANTWIPVPIPAMPGMSN